MCDAYWAERLLRCLASMDAVPPGEQSRLSIVNPVPTSSWASFLAVEGPVEAWRATDWAVANEGLQASFHTPDRAQ
jgi:hypothetical protein